MSPHNPRSLAEYNNELYVCKLNNAVLVVINKAIIRSFTACSAARIKSMVFDECGLMAIQMEHIKTRICQLHQTYLMLDLKKGRFVILLGTKLDIYH